MAESYSIGTKEDKEKEEGGSSAQHRNASVAHFPPFPYTCSPSAVSAIPPLLPSYEAFFLDAGAPFTQLFVWHTTSPSTTMSLMHPTLWDRSNSAFLESERVLDGGQRPFIGSEQHPMSLTPSWLTLDGQLVGERFHEYPLLSKLYSAITPDQQLSSLQVSPLSTLLQQQRQPLQCQTEEAMMSFPGPTLPTSQPSPSSSFPSTSPSPSSTGSGPSSPALVKRQIQSHLSSRATTPPLPPTTVSALARVPASQHHHRHHPYKTSYSADPPLHFALTDTVPPLSELNRRRRLTVDETEHLLDQFYRNEKPSTRERAEIAAHLNLDPRTVQVWFQNRRAKLKRDDSLARVIYGEEMGQQQQQQQQHHDAKKHARHHSKDNPETFLGFEGADAGYADLLLDADLQKLLIQNLNSGSSATAMANSLTSKEGSRGGHQQQQQQQQQQKQGGGQRQREGGEMADSKHDIVEYCDLDLGLDFCYELMMYGLETPACPSSFDIDADVESLRWAEGVSNVGEEGDEVLSSCPLLFASTSTSLDSVGWGLGGSSHMESRPSHIVETFSGTSGWKRDWEEGARDVDGKRQSAERGREVSLELPLSSLSMRRNAFVLHGHNPIPRQQMAMTLIPKAKEADSGKRGVKK